MEKIHKKMNAKLVNILKYTLFFILFYILGKAGINNLIFPFAIGAFFALVWCNQSIIVLSPLYVIASFLIDFSVYSLLSAMSVAIIFLIIYGIHYKLKKPIKVWGMILYSLLCMAFKVFMEIYFDASLYLCFLNVLFAVLFMLVCIKTFEVFICRGITNRLTSLEIICSSIFLASIFCGLTFLSISGIEFVKLFGVFLILFSSFTLSVQATMLIGMVSGFGTLLYNNNPVIMVSFICYTICAIAFKTKNKYIPAIAIIFAEVCLGYYFKIEYNYTLISAIPCLVGCIIYSLIPIKTLNNVAKIYTSTMGSLTMQSVVNRNREVLYKRIYELSEVFAEMDKVFRAMIKGGLAIDEAKQLLFSEIKQKICSDCSEKNKCHRAFGEETYEQIAELVDIAFDKGKVTLLDVSPYLTTKCSKITQLVGTVNELLAQYKNYAGLMNNIDASRVLVAEQLSGVSKIMKELSFEVNKQVDFDLGRERKIIDELTYNNIICSDALIYQDNKKILSATLAIRKEDISKVKIAQVVSKVCGQKMFVASEDSSKRAGYSILNLKTSPKYDIIFGTSACTKTSSNRTGDCYSLIRISADKFLIALCDGMGSGERAERASNIAIGLVENFYKAGFDNEIILSSVNKLLSLGKDDIFSALNLAVIDLREGIGDFIKLGSPESFIKRGDIVEVIETGALPLGIVQNAQPMIKKVALSSQDLIVLCTDGISDSFSSVDALSDFINNSRTLNPQDLADKLVERATVNNGNYARDDMTVIVARIYAAE